MERGTNITTIVTTGSAILMKSVTSWPGHKNPLQGQLPALCDLASVTAQSYQISGPAPVVSMALKALPKSSHLALQGELLRGELSWNVSPVGQRTPPAALGAAATPP